MKPLVLKGHERPLTHIQYNRDGDLLFSCAKDNKATVWRTETGERLGTYNAHQGGLYHLDVNFTSTRLLTAGADAMCYLWDVETGEALHCFPHKSSVRCVGFAEGDRHFLSVGHNSMRQPASVFVYKLNHDDWAKQSDTPVTTLLGHENTISRAAWGMLNETIVSVSDDATIRLWDVETGREIAQSKAHRKGINNMRLSHDKTMLVTSAKDHTSKLFDARTLECLHTYSTDSPVNAAVISPIKPHVILGGGQDAMAVTRTSARSGKFEAHFYNIYKEEWLGSLPGHFGPINTLDISPDGKHFASGAEDGYIRIHGFDESYLNARAE